MSPRRLGTPENPVHPGFAPGTGGHGCAVRRGLLCSPRTPLGCDGPMACSGAGLRPQNAGRGRKIASPMPAVSFQSVSKTYSTPRGPFHALSGVGLDIEEGEFFGLLGPMAQARPRSSAFWRAWRAPAAAVCWCRAAMCSRTMRRRAASWGGAAGTGVRSVLQCARGAALPVGLLWRQGQ